MKFKIQIVVNEKDLIVNRYIYRFNYFDDDLSVLN